MVEKYNFLTKAIFKTEDILKEVSSESQMFATIRTLIKSERIAKLKGGLYATINPITQDIFANRFEIATAIQKEAFVGYHSALEFYGLGNQMYSEVHVLTPTQYAEQTIGELNYLFFKTNYFYGISVIEQNTTIRITELERTVVDCLDRLDVAGGIEEVFTALSAISYCDEEKILKHLNNYGKKFIYKKAGYFFSLIKPSYLSERFYKVCKENISLRDDDIRENKRIKGKYINEWKLIVPDGIINTEN